MASYKNFRSEVKKYTNGIHDIYKKPKNNNNINQQLGKEGRLREGFKRWTSFYRANPHRFADEYLGIGLHLFQKILVYLCFHVDYLMYLASRGQGKSWLIAVICCVRCILYPQTKIIVASGTKGQAKLVITEKIAKDLINYPNLAREIKEIKTSANEIVVIFQNGSTITAVTSNDNARGYRGNILILDEFRLIKEDVLKKVLRPFLTVVRQPPYLKKSEYAHLKESNKEIYISSAWYKSHWIWKKFRAFAKKMVKDKDKFNYFACGLPYQLSMLHGLLDEKRVKEIKSEEDMDEISWLMEMECMFFGESENAWFKLESIQDCRNLIKPFYPQTTEQFLQDKDKRKKSTKQDGEIRVVGVDVALMEDRAKEDNDNTIYTFVRLLPKGEEYERQVSYIESINGAHPTIQAIKLKQMFYDLECDYVAMDTTGNGMSLYDECTKVFYDEERDVEYPAWCSMNDEKMESRAFDKSALPIIYSIKATKQINHEMAMLLKSSFEKKKIKLLINDIQGKEYLIEKQDYMKKSPTDKVNMLKPYTQTTLLVNEMVNLEYAAEGGYVSVKEVGRNRKDRYSSLGYANYYARILELKLKKKRKVEARDYALW